MKTIRRQLAFALFSACAGCSVGGQTGEGDVTVPSCEDAQSEQFALGTMTPLGFSADDLLRRLHAAERALPGRWSSQQADESQLASESSADASEVSVSVHFEARGQAVVVTRKGPSENYYTLPCDPRLDVPVTVQLTVEGADGTFRAEFPSKLEAYSIEMAKISQEVPTNAVTDTLLPALDSGQRVESYWFGGRFSEHGQAAEVRASVGPKKKRDRLIEWSQADGCSEFSVAVPLQAEVLGVSAATAIELLPKELPLLWQDGSRTTLHLQAVPAQANACFEDPCPYECFSGEENEEQYNNRAALMFPIDLKLFTDDERWSTTLHTDLYVELIHTGGPVLLEIDLWKDFETAAEVMRELGIELDEWGSGHRARLRLNLGSRHLEDRRFGGHMELYVQDVQCASRSSCPPDECENPCHVQEVSGSIGERADAGTSGEPADAGTPSRQTDAGR